MQRVQTEERMAVKVKQRLIQYLLSRKEEEGFTLVELIVVVMIIGILSSIAIPSFMSAGDKAKQKEASVALSAYVRAAQAYYTENSQNAVHAGHLANYVSVIACANASNPSGCKDSPPINLENTQATSWNTPSGLYAIGIISSNSQVQFTANPSEGFNGYGVSACFSSQTGSTKVVESSTKERLVTPPNCN